MNKFAVITRSQRQKFFKKPTITEYDNYVTLELPYTIEQMRTIDERKLYKSLSKGINKLQRSGISRAIFTNTLKEIFDSNIKLQNFRVVDGTMMFFDFVPKMVEFFCKKYEFIRPNIKLGIREENFSFISQNLIEQLCYDSKFISIETTEIISSKRYARFLLDKFGIMLNIRDTENTSDNNDIVIDVDNFCVYTLNGDCIDGIEIEGVQTIEDAEIFDVMMCCGLSANDVLVTSWKNDDKFIDIV